MSDNSKTRRVGIFAGTFNPAHTGHIAFALQAGELAQLDAVYLLPERQPRGKRQVTAFAHRIAMLQAAVHEHPNLGVLELADETFTTEQTLPKLQRKFGDAQLVLLFGSDIVTGLARWPNVEQLLAACELVIGLREHERHEVEQQLSSLPIQPKARKIIVTKEVSVSSGKIRTALRDHHSAPGLLPSVEIYNDQYKLYA